MPPRPSTTTATLAFAAFTLFLPGPASAQEVGFVAVGASSGNAELPDPKGLGVFAQVDLASWLLRLSYVRYTDDTEKSGVVCEVYSPRIGCRTETVVSSARMGGLRFTVQRALSLGGVVEFAAGGGVSFNSLGATTTGESGSRADLHLPNTGQIGALGTVSVALQPVPAVPVRLVGGIQGHWVRFKGCVDPNDPTSGYAPFCGSERFAEVWAGVSVVLPKQE